MEAQLAQGFKLKPGHFIGQLNLPYYGDVFYVDPSAGNDTANDGSTPNNALKTVTAAYAKMTSGAHDITVIAPTGGTGRSTESAAITWAKRFAHIVGAAAPIKNSPRAGMAFTATGQTTTAQFTVSENGCIFKNLTLYQGVADSYVLANVTGDYNYFEGVHFNGMVNATAGDQATGRDLKLTGADDNVFVNCTIGNNTTARSAANACLEATGGSARNVFDNCDFIVYPDNAGVLFFKAASAGNIDRYIRFKDCAFFSPGALSAATTMTIGMSIHAAAGGMVWLDGNTKMYGATNLCDTATAVYSSANIMASAADSGLMAIYANS